MLAVVGKLGHSDDAVRERALKSILFKLANGLATYEQLWQVCRVHFTVVCLPLACMLLCTLWLSLARAGRSHLIIPIC